MIRPKQQPTHEEHSQDIGELSFRILRARSCGSELQKSCVKIWRAFRNDEPELATRILNFGWDEAATAVWFGKFVENLPSSAAKYASGNRAEIADRILRSAHGALS